MHTRIGILAVVVGMVLLSLPGTLCAQTANTGTVLGTVMDPTGAVIPNAKVQLKDLATETVRSTTTNAAGQYTFTTVLPGLYSLTITTEGFRQAVVSSVTAEVAKSSLVNVTMELGAVAETVEVAAGARQELQTVDAAVGEVVDSHSLVNLPTVTRRVIELAFLQVGSMPNMGNANISRTIAGARGDQNTYTLDGLDISDVHVGGSCCGNIGMGIAVPVESIVEFRGGVSNQNASFGRSMGASFNLTSRRGSNELHGAAYWYHRNDNLNANSWARNRLGQENPELKDNRAGFRVGGPFKKDKLFFFLNAERRRFPKKGDIVRTVPSSTLRQGILRFRDNAGNIVSYDLRTSTLCGPTNSSPCDPRGRGISPVISQQFALLPAGNDPASGAGGGPDVELAADGLNAIGVRGPADESEESDNVLARLDYQISEKWHFNGTWAWSQQRFNLTGYADIRGGAGDIKSRFRIPNDPYHYNFGVTGQLTPRVTNEVRFGHNKSTIVFQMPDPSVLLPQAAVALDLIGIAEPIDIANARSQIGIGRTWQVVDNITWVKGKHTLQGGINLNWLRFFHSRRGAGGLGFGGLNPDRVAEIGINRFTVVSPTSRPPTCTASGQANCLRAGDLARWDQLYAATLGIVDSVFHFITRDMNTGLRDLDPQVLAGGIVNEGTWQHYEFHLTDTWRVTNSLTLSIGANAIVETPVVEIKNRRAFLIDLETGQPVYTNDFLAKRAAAARLGRAYNPGFAYSPRRFHPGVREAPVHKSIAPRFAAAWNPSFKAGLLGRLFGDHKTVFRMGYGLGYQRIMAVGHLQAPLSGNAALAEPNIVSAPRCNFSGTPGAGCAPGDPNVANSGFRVGVDGPAPLPTPVVQIPLPFIPLQPFGAPSQPHWTPDYKFGYVNSGDFTIQRELPGDFLLEIGWIGRYGRRLPVHKNINAVPFFIADLSRQSAQMFAQAFDVVATQLRAGVLPANVTPQPWFENSLFAGATVALATSNPTDFIQGFVQNLWLNRIDPLLISLGRPPINNRQIRRTLSTTHGGWNNYNAAFLSVNKRLSRGLSFNFNYTIAKNLETLGGVTDSASGTCMNNFDYSYCYGPALSDRKHGVNFYGVYELPFGLGRRFGTGSGWSNKLIGGWQVSWVSQWFSGRPLLVTQGDQPFGSDVSQESAPLIRDPKANIGRHLGVAGSGGIGTAGNMNVFSDPRFVFESFRRFLISEDARSSRGVIRGLPWATLDLSLAKKTVINERISITFSLDFLNFLNHPVFNDPVLNLNAPAAFGVISSQPGTFAGSLFWAARQIQTGLRVEF